jgi:hypothetical protein
MCQPCRCHTAEAHSGGPGSEQRTAPHRQPEAGGTPAEGVPAHVRLWAATQSRGAMAVPVRHPHQTAPPVREDRGQGLRRAGCGEAKTGSGDCLTFTRQLLTFSIMISSAALLIIHSWQPT